MPITVLVPPQSQTLASLARVKSELRLTDDDATRDDLLSTLILEASAMIVKEIGYPVWRARVRETLVGDGRSELMLSRTPVVYIESITIDDEEVDATDYEIDSSVGLVLHNEAWPNTHHRGVWLGPEEKPDLGKHDIVVDYWGGVFGPDDNVAASGVEVDGVNERFVFGAPPLVVPGDTVEAVSFGEAGNNGQFTVVTRSETGITVSQDLTTEAAAPAGAKLLVRNLDRALERLCVQAVKAWYVQGGEHDPSVTSERIGDWSATYGNATGESAHDLPASVLRALDRWRRIV